MPPLSATQFASAVCASERRDVNNTLTEEESPSLGSTIGKGGKTTPDAGYYYLDKSNWRIIWPNVTFFLLLHLVHFYTLATLLTFEHSKSWILCEYFAMTFFADKLFLSLSDSPSSIYAVGLVI